MAHSPPIATPADGRAPQLVRNPGFIYTFNHLAVGALIRHRLANQQAENAQAESRMTSTNLIQIPAPAAQGDNAGATFQQQATESIQNFRRALSAMFDASNMPVFKSRDILKYFGVDINLSWQIFKLLGPGDLLGLAKYIPPAVSMQRLFAACRSKKIAEPLILAAESAFDQFENFVALHAGERARFESMAASMAEGDEAAQADIQQRKALFRAHAHFWGIEVGTAYLINMIAPSREHPDVCDNLSCANLLDFRRLRPNADTYVMAMQQKIPTDTSVYSREPIDADALATHQVPVIPKFSTNALPLMRTEVNEWGLARMRLVGETVGLSSSVDLALGEISHGVMATAAHGPVGIASQSVTARPTQRLIMETLVDRRYYSKLTANINMYGHVSPAFSARDQEKPEWRLPCREQVQHLTPNDDTRIAEIPRRRELLTYLCDRQGWSLDNFDVYRLHIEYPMLDTLIEICLTR